MTTINILYRNIINGHSVTSTEIPIIVPCCCVICACITMSHSSIGISVPLDPFGILNLLWLGETTAH